MLFIKNPLDSLVHLNKRDIEIVYFECYNIIRKRASIILEGIIFMNLNFAENFKNLRKQKGITQEKISEALGVSSQSVSRWELGICYPDIEMLPSIANYFGVSVDNLLSNDVDSKKKDLKLFKEKMASFDEYTEELIEFVSEYCKKYPDVDYYAYELMWVIKGYIVVDEEKTGKYMPVLLKNAERLLPTQYRTAVIHIMAVVSPENELEKWLNMAPYSGFSRRACLVFRAAAHDEHETNDIQQGLEVFETFAIQLDRRFPDKLGSAKKALFQKSVLRTIESFGENGEIPDAWKAFYAYKQLVLAACLFAQKKTEEAWENFDSAIEKCKYIYSLEEKWLSVGGRLFANIKVSKDWNFAVDEKGNEHRLFGITYRSFSDMKLIYDLLTYPCWSWFNSVRETEKYKAAVKWVSEAKENIKDSRI